MCVPYFSIPKRLGKVRVFILALRGLINVQRVEECLRWKVAKLVIDWSAKGDKRYEILASILRVFLTFDN